MTQVAAKKLNIDEMEGDQVPAEILTNLKKARQDTFLPPLPSFYGPWHPFAFAV